MSDERRWTLINESDYDFAYLAYDGPAIKAGDRVDVVPASRLAELTEALALAAGYYQAVEEQLRSALAHPDRPDDGLWSMVETAANIAMHQRRNIEALGVKPTGVQVMTLSGDMRGENALSALSGVTAPVRAEAAEARVAELQAALCEARDALLGYVQGESGLPFMPPYDAVRKALRYIDAAVGVGVTADRDWLYMKREDAELLYATLGHALGGVGLTAEEARVALKRIRGEAPPARDHSEDRASDSLFRKLRGSARE